MKHSDNDFNNIDKSESDETRREPTFPVPFSLRLSFEERARLEAEAGELPVGAYIRQRLFRDKETPRKRRGKSPVKDHVALGRVLGALGQSRIANNLNQLARAVNTGSLPVTPETEDAIKDACRDVAAMRQDLLLALGVRSSGSGSKTGPGLTP